MLHIFHNSIQFLCLTTCLLACLISSALTLNGRVVKVADGDTITVLDQFNVQHKIRLNRIDAPEKKQAFGQVSKQHLSSMVFNKTVEVEYTKKDKYGRILGTVMLDGVDVNLKMVADGMAWHYKRFDNTPSYSNAENSAKSKRIGLWVDPNPVQPELFRHK